MQCTAFMSFSANPQELQAQAQSPKEMSGMEDAGQPPDQ